MTLADDDKCEFKMEDVGPLTDLCAPNNEELGRIAFGKHYSEIKKISKQMNKHSGGHFYHIKKNL